MRSEGGPDRGAAMHWCKVGGREVVVVRGRRYICWKGGGGRSSSCRSTGQGRRGLNDLPGWKRQPDHTPHSTLQASYLSAPTPSSGLAAALLSTCLLHGTSRAPAFVSHQREGTGGAGTASPSDTVLDVVLSRVGLAQFFQRWELEGGGKGGRAGCPGRREGGRGGRRKGELKGGGSGMGALASEHAAAR